MVKSYLRYSQTTPSFGCINNTDGNVLFDRGSSHVLTCSLDSVARWQLRSGELNAKLHTQQYNGQSTTSTRPYLQTGDVRYIASNPMHPEQVAAGSTDGSIRLYDLNTNALLIALNSGHTSAITTLVFSDDGQYLISGSLDSSIIVWDVSSGRGLNKFTGHKAPITHLCWLHGEGTQYIISSSKDGLIKVWNVQLEYCVETVSDTSVGSSSEVWAMALNKDKTRLITGGNHTVLKVYALNLERPAPASDEPAATATGMMSDVLSKSEQQNMLIPIGILQRNSNKRVTQLKFNPSNTILYCASSDKVIDVYYVRNAAHIEKKRRRRERRAKSKKSAAAGTAEEESKQDHSDNADSVNLPNVGDEFAPLLPLRCNKRVSSFDVTSTRGSTHSTLTDRIVVALNNNALVSYTMSLPTDVTEDDSKLSKTDLFTSLNALELPGHRTGIRSTALSADGSMVLTTSSEQIKVWNTATGNCVRTMDSGYGLCSVFVPGSRHAVVGTKEGTLEVWEMGTGICLEKIQAHESSVWSIDLRPDGRGLVSGGGDKQVKFWEFELILPPSTTAPTSATPRRQLSLVHTRTLQLTDDVLCVKHSPDSRFVAVGLLDSTIKVFYEDSLKFYLSLYGHKLPVLSIDISSDSQLLVSSSADKSLKIWGLDFGDLHRSIHAHDDSIMKVVFIPRTHYIVSCSKDRYVKQYDADTFEAIQVFGRHSSEVWALTCSADGQLLVSAGNDKSVRIWHQTDEQIFLEEERQRELDAAFASSEKAPAMIGQLEGSNLIQPGESTAVASGQAPSEETMAASERLIEALDAANEEVERWQSYQSTLQRRLLDADSQSSLLPAPPANPLMRGKTSIGFVYQQLAAISPSEVDEALLLLPYSYAVQLLLYLDRYISYGVGRTELAVRCICTLIHCHQSQIIATHSSLTPRQLHEMHQHAVGELTRIKSDLGYNMAALQYMAATVKDNQTDTHFGAADTAPEKKRRKVATE